MARDSLYKSFTRMYVHTMYTVYAAYVLYCPVDLLLHHCRCQAVRL